MTARLHHRGPDSRGTYVSEDGCAAIGNTRLAITDPQAAIDLPLFTSDGRSLLSFNGEIYNFQELRRDLEAGGMRFKHRTDTEVLAEGLRQFGEAFLQRLDGMWAFAYYDLDARRLLLGRDLLGERHVFYRVLDDEFVFASEPLPILADGGRREEIDMPGVVSALRYYAAPPGQTLVKGLRRLRPGHNLSVDAAGTVNEYRISRLHPEKWFDFFDSHPDLDSVVTHFESIMQTVSLRRLPRDVPYIATLSGGLDSTLICTYASDFGRTPLATLFAQSSESPGRNSPDELDEYEASCLTSNHLGTNHRHIHINDVDCIPVLRSLARNGFDGILDPGVASFEMLAREVNRSGMKVMLISDGPDELAGGYAVDRKAWHIDRLRAGSPLRYSIRKIASSFRLGRRALAGLGHGKHIIPPDVSYAPFHFQPQHQANGVDTLRYFFDNRSVDWITKSFGGDDPAYADIVSRLDPTQRRALSYASISLPDMFNLRTDKAFLRASVECRLPFEAVELAEFLIALPAELRFGDGSTTKFLFRKIVERRVSDKVANRSKHGFSAPLFDTPEIDRALDMRSVIGDSTMFADLPFERGARDWALHPNFRKMQWPLYALSLTHEQLKTGVYSGADIPESVGKAQ
jgi:asparagine synthase (glutamine-hydrolysing)